MAAIASQLSAVSPTRDWKELYVAALLENDKNLIPSLITDAERAIVLRARQLFHDAGNNLREGQALDDALLTLRTLKACLATRAQFVQQHSAAVH